MEQSDFHKSSILNLQFRLYHQMPFFRHINAAVTAIKKTAPIMAGEFVVSRTQIANASI